MSAIRSVQIGFFQPGLKTMFVILSQMVSPKRYFRFLLIFQVYSIDDLTYILNTVKTGCYVGNYCLNHIMFANDICLFSLSLVGLQGLLHKCYKYAQSRKMLFNLRKSFGMLFALKNYNLSFSPNEENNKKLCTKLEWFLLKAQAFVSYCTFRQVQWHKNNNAIKTKFTPTALNVIKRHM